MISLAKQFSRLSSVFISLENEPAGDLADDAASSMKKSMNNHFLPQASSETVESFIQVNNKRWPAFNTLGTKEHYFRLQQCVGLWNSQSHSMNISGAGYGDGSAESRQFMIGFDFDTIPHADASGISVQGGGLVQATLKNVGDVRRVFVMTHADAVLEIKAQGSVLYS